MELTWQHWFEIGHDAIDFEHKIFFGLIHKLQCFAAEERSKAELHGVLNEIVKYTDFHFTSEEHIMAEAGYDQYPSHRNMHANLMRQLRELVTLFESGARDPQEIVAFLFSWLVEHTISEDLNISKAIKEKKLKSFFKSA